MTATINAKARNDMRGSNTKKIRKEGLIPAVVYGKEKEPVTISLDSVELIKKVREEGKNAVFSLDIEGGQTLDVMLYDYQSDVIKDELIHADFYQVDMSSEVDVEVYINVEGESMGEKDGGVRQQTMHQINVRATPNNIPEEITVEVSELEIGDSVTVGDLNVTGKYEIMDDEESTIITILPPQQEDIPEAGEEGLADDEQAEPEVIGEKSDDEEDNKEEK
ncbi:50S ribosomal protein L25/general stress protein Ctc [Halalkalibacillus sediminis]|uniref:Large ribosomal subunit protein bL25 n=1 Tax=Halalkalibacillus sediminis TaxID=2018042 RepID=A0A2I0QT32_9BACI|nr:50S ribosomal protein L25/general stress protein Ctc [Halalkalibacillus sediminis]PKR77502.1 50S ribosomal protein L25/general stress protein Ctc [Halalkalibacillus sediminis]